MVVKLEKIGEIKCSRRAFIGGLAAMFVCGTVAVDEIEKKFQAPEDPTWKKLIMWLFKKVTAHDYIDDFVFGSIKVLWNLKKVDSKMKKIIYITRFFEYIKNYID